MLETKDLLKKIREEYGYSVYEMGEKLLNIHFGYFFVDFVIFLAYNLL